MKVAVVRRGSDAVVLLLLVVLLSSWAYVVATTPSLFRAYDPEFDYFVTSLAPFKGQPYAYADHPGTPVELIGTALMGLSYPFIGGESAGLIDFYLRHPEVFFRMAYAFLILANLACVMYFYFTARAVGGIGALPALALALMYYAPDSTAIGTITYWSHAAFSFPFGTLYLLVLFRVLRAAGGALRYRTLIWLGVGAGVLTSIIMYLGPWVVGAVVAVMLFYRLKGMGWGRTLAAGGTLVLSALAGFFVAIIPILWKWTTFWRWVLKLVLNQGRFGNAGPGILPVSTSLASFSGFVRDEPFLFIALGALLVLLLVVWLQQRGEGLRGQAAEWSLALGLVVQIILLLAIISKAGFSFYLLPVQATLPVLALVLLCLLGSKARMRLAIGALVLLFVLFRVPRNFYERAWLERHLAVTIAEDHAHLVKAIQDAAFAYSPSAQDPEIIWAYGVFEHCNALLDGNYYAGLPLNAEIAAVCPGQHYLPHGSKSAIIDGVRLAVEEAVSAGWMIVIRSAESQSILQLLPHATVQTIPSSATTGLGDLVIIFP